MLRPEETVPGRAPPPLRPAQKPAKPIPPTGIATDQLFASNHFKNFRQTRKHQKAHTPFTVFFYPSHPMPLGARLSLTLVDVETSGVGNFGADLAVRMRLCRRPAKFLD